MMFSFLHRVWERVVRKGDTVIDATCGNGYDTLTMVKMVADESTKGCVYEMDIQNDALENTTKPRFYKYSFMQKSIKTEADTEF